MPDDTKATPSFGLRLPKDMLDSIDRHRSSFPYPPSRSAVLRRIVAEWIEHQARKPRVPLQENGA